MLHLFFGIGALAAPLLVYAGLAVATRSGSALCLVLAAWSVTIPAPTRPVAAREEHTDTTIALLALLGLFFTLYVGTELGFAGWIKTYGEEIEFTSLAATWLTTVFWIGFTLGRAIASALAHRVTPLAILWVSCSATVGGALVLIIGGGATAPVWIGTVIMGAATAPQFPAMMNLAEQRIHVTGAATTWFVGGAGMGGSDLPVGRRPLVRPQRGDCAAVGDAAVRVAHPAVVRHGDASARLAPSRAGRRLTNLLNRKGVSESG